MPATHHVPVRAVIMLPAAHVHADRCVCLATGCTCKPVSARLRCLHDHKAMTAVHQQLMCLTLEKARAETVFGLNASQGRNREKNDYID